jgi:hypothetical protein
MAARQHPVFAVLAEPAGITTEVLRALERTFPTVVFVVLASERTSMLDLSERLGVTGVGAALRGAAWKAHVHHEHRLATERSDFRRDLKRLKRAIHR